MERLRNGARTSGGPAHGGDAGEVDNVGANAISRAYHAYTKLTEEQPRTPRRRIQSFHLETCKLLEASNGQLSSNSDRWRLGYGDGDIGRAGHESDNLRRGYIQNCRTTFQDEGPMRSMTLRGEPSGKDNQSCAGRPTFRRGWTPRTAYFRHEAIQ